MQAFAEEGLRLSETTLLSNLKRVAAEAHGLEPDSTVNWEARGELRPQPGKEAEAQVWLYLTAQTRVPLTCQRCMAAVAIPLEVKQWYRFVADEDIAMAEDDEAEEDLLVMTPQFDLLAVLEDELLMAMPLVPMHEQCPVAPAFSAGDQDIEQAEAKPNPFAMLVNLKKTST